MLKSRSRVFGQFRDSDTLVTFVAVAVIVCLVLQINSQMSVLEVALSTAKGEIGQGVSVFWGLLHGPWTHWFMLPEHMVCPNIGVMSRKPGFTKRILSVTMVDKCAKAGKMI